jgi:hypothetical protein
MPQILQQFTDIRLLKELAALVLWGVVDSYHPQDGGSRINFLFYGVVVALNTGPC